MLVPCMTDCNIARQMDALSQLISNRRSRRVYLTCKHSVEEVQHRFWPCSSSVQAQMCIKDYKGVSLSFLSCCGLTGKPQLSGSQAAHQSLSPNFAELEG